MGLFKSIGKAFKKVGKAVVKVAPYALAAAAAVYTGGAALGATGSFSSAVASGATKLGLKGAVGNILTKAVTQAGMGAMQGFVTGGKSGLKSGFKSGLLSGAGEGLIDAGTQIETKPAGPSFSSSDPSGSSRQSLSADASGDFMIGGVPDWAALGNGASSNGLLGPQFVAGAAGGSGGGSGGGGAGGGAAPTSIFDKIEGTLNKYPNTINLIGKGIKALKKKKDPYNAELEVAKFEAERVANNYKGRGGLLTTATNILDNTPRPKPPQFFGPDLGYEWSYNPVTRRIERIGIEPVQPRPVPTAPST